MSGVVIRPMEASRDDVERFAACFTRNDFPREVASVAWQFLENPVKKLYADFAIAHSGELGAIYASFPSHFKLGETTRVGLQSLDTLTDKDHRGQGLFKKLASSVFSRCEEENVDFIYGFPNGNSAHGFFERLGWTSLDPVPFLIRPLKTRYFFSRARLPQRIVAHLPDVSLASRRLPRLPSGDSVRSVLSFTEFDVDRIWSAFSQSFQVGLRRDREYLSWRTAKPREQYKTLVYYSGGQATGFVTYAVKSKHGGRIGYILELMHDPDAKPVGKALLRHAIRDMMRSDADAVLSWCFSHSANYSSYRASGFFPLPEKFRPIELHFGVRPLASQSPDQLLQRRNWYISYCDSDTV